MVEANIEKVASLLSLEFYRFKRYGVPVCLILVEIEEALFNEVVSKTIRRTDLFKQIDEDFYAIVYTHADLDDARNAFFNVFMGLDERSYISRLAIAEALESDTSVHEMILRAYRELLAPKESAQLSA